MPKKILVEVSGLTQAQALRRSEILESINEELTIDELEKLLKVAKSSTAKSYLTHPLKWMTLKGFLKL